MEETKNSRVSRTYVRTFENDSCVSPDGQSWRIFPGRSWRGWKLPRSNKSKRGYPEQTLHIWHSPISSLCLGNTRVSLSSCTKRSVERKQPNRDRFDILSETLRRCFAASCRLSKQPRRLRSRNNRPSLWTRQTRERTDHRRPVRLLYLRTILWHFRIASSCWIRITNTCWILIIVV